MKKYIFFAEYQKDSSGKIMKFFEPEFLKHETKFIIINNYMLYDHIWPDYGTNIVIVSTSPREV